jgi:hypothetical protein
MYVISMMNQMLLYTIPQVRADRSSEVKLHGSPYWAKNNVENVEIQKLYFLVFGLTIVTGAYRRCK